MSQLSGNKSSIMKKSAYKDSYSVSPLKPSRGSGSVGFEQNVASTMVQMHSASFIGGEEVD